MAHVLVPSENWDDDFEFTSNSHSKHKHARKPDPTISPPLAPRMSVASSHFSEDWDADDGCGQPSPKAPSGISGISTTLDNWAEPGPSTPTKFGGTQAENWDDDFEDKGDSPPSRRHHAHRASVHAFHHAHPTHSLRTRHSYHTPPRPKARTEPENWDDDFDDPMDPTSPISPIKTDNDNTPMTKRTRREAYADTSDEEDGDLGFSDDKEEDKTVTARARTAPMPRSGTSNPPSGSPPPPVPPLPHALSPSPIEPFPRSPTVSVFSIPTTSGRNSIGYFNSTSHLVLSGASSLAPSPPARERRRLRKKSRPPNMDNNVFELIEEPRDSCSPPPLPPSTPERERASSPPMVSTMPSSLEATPGKTALLSRIGSVKRWNVRRKRASTSPAEAMMMQDLGTSNGAIAEEDGASRPPSSLDQTQAQTPSGRNRTTNHPGGLRPGWFFRPGGAHYGAGSPPPGQAELKHEKSLEQARLRPGVGVVGSDGSGQVPTTPSKLVKISRRKASGILEYTSSSDLTGESSSTSGVMGLGKPSLGPNRRPSSMQVPNGVSLAVGTVVNKFGSVGTRHASYGSSMGRASSSRVFSTPTPTESAEDLPPIPPLPLQEGSRSFMGSVRKLSLAGGKKHKKRKSSIEIAQIPPASALLQDSTGDEGAREHDANGDAKMETQSRARTPDLLPPIELHPPSPPRAINGMSAATSIPLILSDGAESVMPSTSAPPAVTMHTIISASPITPSKPVSKTPSSPQSASLGRTAQAPVSPPSTATVPRRNSLGDLKIPARISQAQIGLKRDLGMVREFATSIDRLKELQSTYHHLLAEVQTFLENAPPSRAASPSTFGLVRSHSRLRSNTSPPSTSSSSATTSFPEHKHIAAMLHTIGIKYKISWECAELLIELGGGAPASPPSSGLSVSMQAELDRRKNRERAVTLSGEESKSPPVPIASTPPPSSSTSGPETSWRASTGRHDLSQRQLLLLRDMLNGGELPPDDVPLIEENVNRNWRWGGDGMNSTVTLPSEESDPRGGDHVEGVKKKRRGGRMGLTGLRDMLRMLKRSHSEQVAIPPMPLPAASTASLSTDSSYSHHYPHGQLSPCAERKPKTSSGPESVPCTQDVPVNSPYGGPSLTHKASPRRPSLASIFRLGKNKTTTSSAGESSQDSRSDIRSASRGSTRTDEEDWDRIETAIDLDTAARTLGIESTATIKGRHKGRAAFLSEPHSPVRQGQATVGPTTTHRPVTPRRGQQELPQVLRLEVESSPRSLRPMRSTRLSNVEEVEGEQSSSDANGKTKRVSLARTSSSQQPLRTGSGSGGPLAGSTGGGGRMGSIRSAPPTQVDEGLLPDIKLSMTPENIRPLLENAKEVHVRCHECIRELRALVDVVAGAR